jgi:hypothetical protein
LWLLCQDDANIGRDAVSFVGGLVLIASGVQGGHARASGYETVLIAVLIVTMALAAVAVYRRRSVRSRRGRPVADEWAAQAVMGELCPEGWQAQITLYGWGAPIPPDAPPSRVPLVELEWRQYEEEGGRVAVARRVWAPSIREALETMVEDRRTDLTLEEIERESGGEWEGR